MTGTSSDLFESEWLERLGPSQLFSLADRVAIVTGAAGGIGSWLSAGLAKAGASVVATDRDPSGTVEVAEALSAAGLTVAPLVVDLEEVDSPQRIVDFAVERFGRLDILVNNAGINKRIPMLEVTTGLLEQIWRVDYTRIYELSQAAVRVMIGQGGGTIIHMSSLNNQVGLEDVSMLGPTKAALSQLSKAMTVEFAHLGVRTNALAPGFMATPMNESHWSDETRAPWIMDRTPMCRPGHPAELVGTCLLLASDAGSFISGQTIYVDGGFISGSRWNVPPYAGLKAYQAHLKQGK